MWHEFGWNDISQFKDHYYYLVTHTKYETPMKAKWHNEMGGCWQILGGTGDNSDYVYSWDEKYVIAWMELPEIYKGAVK